MFNSRSEVIFPTHLPEIVLKPQTSDACIITHLTSWFIGNAGFVKAISQSAMGRIKFHFSIVRYFIIGIKIIGTTQGQSPYPAYCLKYQ